MNNKHTPGPWRVGMKPGPMIYGPKGEQVADLTADLLPKDEQLANMRLMLAAPELLEALAGMLEYAPAPKGIRADFHYTLHREMALRAIAKATGRE